MTRSLTKGVVTAAEKPPAIEPHAAACHGASGASWAFFHASYNVSARLGNEGEGDGEVAEFSGSEVWE